MSLYRQAGRRSGSLAVAVVAALLIGFGLGYVVSRATADEPTLEEAIADVQSEAAPVADALELVGIHYATAREAADAQLERAEESFEDVRPELELLSREATDAAAQAIDQLASLVESGAPAAEVEQAAERARATVRRAALLR